MEEVAEVLFVFVAVEAAHRAAAVLLGVGEVGLAEQWFELFEEGTVRAGIERCGLGRHFALFDSVVDTNPPVADGAVVEIEAKGGKVEARLGGLPGVAGGAPLSG